MIAQLPAPRSAPSIACAMTLAALAACAALLAAGCGENKEKPASQAAARVNGEEITVHQINAELQQAAAGSAAADAGADAARRHVLEGLLDQALLVQQARAAKIDRDPLVLQQLEAARRRILVQAYIDRESAASPPAEEEIKAFYAKHPHLFEQRRLYAFREFLFERSRFTEDLRSRLNGARSPAEVAAILSGAGIRYRETTSTRPAESLPIEALPRVAQLAKGDVIAFTDRHLANVLMLADSTLQPASLERATPLIRQYLVNDSKRALAQAQAKALRAKGRIEYLGSFASPAADAEPAAARPAPGAVADNDQVIERGLRGLRP